MCLGANMDIYGIIDQYQPIISRASWIVKTGRLEIVEDIRQEAAIAVWQQYGDDPQPCDAIMTLVRRVARRIAQRECRRQAHELSVATLPQTQPANIPVTNISMPPDMPPDLQDIATLVLQGLGPGKIAAITGNHRNTIRAKIKKIKQQLDKDQKK